MDRRTFAAMLDFEAAQRGMDFRWKRTILDRHSGNRRLPYPDVDPRPPTVLFRLTLASVEAELAAQPKLRERTPGPDDQLNGHAV